MVARNSSLPPLSLLRPGRGDPEHDAEGTSRRLTRALADLGVDPSGVGLAAAWTKVLTADPRPPKEAGRVVADEDGAGSAALVEFLAAGKYI